MSASWYSRFLVGTRGRLIALLRRDTRTVDELASALDLTDNAVRAHLAALERDGIVRQIGVRRSGSVGKPAYAYQMTAEGEHIFPKPYASVLSALLNALDSQLSSEALEDVLQQVGSRLADDYPPGQGDSRTRLAAATAALNALGGLAELQEPDGSLCIQGYGCPLASLVSSHPEVCHLAEAFVSEVAGIPVRECCNRTGPPRCHFEPATANEPVENP